MTRRFESFVMFAGMRTGSNFLEANLNALGGVTSHGELFNPNFIGRKDRMEMLGVTIAERDADPLAFLALVTGRTEGLGGFRFFHDHDPRVLAAVLDDPACAKIILTRNPAETYVSWKIAQATGQWKLTNVSRLKTARAEFDAAEFETHLTEIQEFHLHLQHRLQTTGQTAFYLDYEDISDVGVLNGLAVYLGVAPTLEATDDTLKKQNPEEIGEKVVNPAEMAAALARIDRFNLTRSPNFEPRRGPAIPSLHVAAGAPLMFLPIRGGPQASVADWLGAFGDRGVQKGMTQKEVRQWKRAQPGHRSFTVLRHPVARAHAVFCSHILSGRMADVRTVMTRQLKVALVPPQKSGAQSLDDHRAAFLAFLRFVKLSLGGQTAVRVDPHWASQGAALQGFAQFQTPDHVLREADLVRGLAMIAGEVGLSAPAYTAMEQAVPHALAVVHDADVEAAVRDAYQRDYVAFGFADWTPVTPPE